MIGTQATRFPELVRDVADAGMRLCNHTRSHNNLTNATPQAMTQDILDGRTDMRTAAGATVPIPYFRAPGGFWSPPMCEIAAQHGMKPVAWSVDPHDWQQPGAGHILESLKRDIHPGAVVLLHDGGGRREQTVTALAQLLPWLTDRGYRFGFPD
jgi:peptidoglycan/xylan/chitin deacetylase (PgdA/CDA1 family)